MIQALVLASAAASALSQEPVPAKPELPAQPFQVRFERSITGRSVTIMLDGRFVKTSHAGKMMCRDGTGAWYSVCADVRTPMSAGKVFRAQAMSTSKVGGNIAMAGSIVAKYFKQARTADECAAIQIAVWEAIEDSGKQADFGSGRFQVRASRQVLDYAQEVYRAVEEKGEAIYLQAGGGGQSQIVAAV